MRNLKPLCAAIVLLISCTQLNAQEGPPVREPDYNKPKLFAALPETIKVDISSLMDLLTRPNGVSVMSRLGNDAEFDFSGQVVSTASKYNNTVQSVVVRSSNFKGAHMSLSRITLEDGSVNYTGRIISFQHGDVFELRRNGSSYEFVKKNFHQLINE